MSRNEQASRRSRAKPDASSGKIHQITFCGDCGEAIPAKAHTCYHCGSKQEHAEEPMQIVFCDRCGKDYPAQAMACFHCGHINPRHPYLTGQISDAG